MLKYKLDQSIRFRFLIIMSCIFFAGTVIISLVVASNEGIVLMNSLTSTGETLVSYITKISSDPLIMKKSIQLDEIVMDAVRGDNIAYAVIYDEQGAPVTSPFSSINYQVFRLGMNFRK